MLRVWEEEIKRQQRKRDTNKKSFYKEANTKMKSHIPLLESEDPSESFFVCYGLCLKGSCVGGMVPRVTVMNGGGGL